VGFAAREYPRSTYDTDFLTTDRAVLSHGYWAPILERGLSVDVRVGDFDDPLAGVVRITAPGEPKIDVVVAKYRWQREVLDRSEPITFEGSLVLVPRLADLLLLKLFAGGYEDRMDIHRVLAGPHRESLIREVEAQLHDLPADARALWKEIVAAP
jgi:hypothetical protein